MVQAKDHVDSREAENCSGPDCEDTVHPTEALTVAWANPLFCSRECRDRWTNRQNSEVRYV